VDDVAGAVALLRAELGEGDVVLVKASRAVGLDRVATALLGPVPHDPWSGGHVRGVFIAAGVALAVSILFTPYLIRFFARQGFGQEIRAEGPSSHQAKRGTPTMGGVAILAAIWIGYVVSHLLTGDPVTPSALLVLFLTTALGVSASWTTSSSCAGPATWG
jgi:hypothetical protein